MSGDHREQQEFGDYVRGGATLVIFLDERKKKRDEELQLWICSGHVMLPDERLQWTTCLCLSNHRGRPAVNLWRTSFPPSPQNCRLIEERSSAAECPKQASWTRLVLNTPDVFTWIAGDGHLETRENTMTTARPQRCIIFCTDDVDIPLRLFSDCRTIMENTGSHMSDNNNPTVYSTSDPNNNPVVDRCEATHGQNFNLRTHKSLLKHPAETSGRDRDEKRRKSVSFDDEVMVYLFDQERPTMDLHSVDDVTLEDNGLEWEDDFSALGESVHVRPFGHSQRRTRPSRPQRYLLPQTCLFLTHVTESDLEP